MPRVYLQSVWKKYWRVCSHQHFSETVWLGADCPCITESHRTRLTPNSISLLCTNCQWETLFIHSFSYSVRHHANIHLIKCKQSWTCMCGQELFAVSLNPFPELVSLQLKSCGIPLWRTLANLRTGNVALGGLALHPPFSWPWDSFLDYLPKASHFRPWPSYQSIEL